MTAFDWKLLIPELEKCLALPRERLCSAVLELCRPQLPPEPAEGWLPWIYQALTLGLYPDPEVPAPDPACLEAVEAVYLPALEWALAHETCPFDPMTDLLAVPSESLPQSRIQAEYSRFQTLVARSHLMALLRIGRVCMPFDTASHVIGVHNVALHAGLLAQKAGLPVDVPLVSAASFAHDVGKFGCRGANARRIPYLHYYYTWTWLEEAGLEEIAQVAANHSTWDLEFENLPMESLLLIYADFRVRGHRENGREVMEICSLERSRDIIFSKLADMTEEKQRRYRTVYCKLRDFEAFLLAHGVSPELGQTELLPVTRTDPALLSSEGALQGLRQMTFENNVRLMHTITTDRSFEQLLEQARSERTSAAIRTYLRLLDEYSTYMSRANKQKTLMFLYELLMHHEGDVRRRAGQIMGQILANSGPRYRKELPQGAPKEAMAPAMMAILDQSADLWDSYIEQCLHPDRRITVNHAQRISNSLKAIAESLFACCDDGEAEVMARPLLRRLETAREDDRYILADALCHVPLRALGQWPPETLAGAITPMLEGPVHHRMVALQALERLLPLFRKAPPAALLQTLDQARQDPEFAVAYLARKLQDALEPRAGQEVPIDTAQMYLSNLKNAVHWTVKLVQIDALCDDAARHPQSAFHTAMHLSNLLSVSEHLPVREHAGQGLLRIAPRLTVDQRNEIVVDLLRELENGRDQVSRFIPPYLGGLLCLLPQKEFDEGVDFLENMIRSGVERSARAAGYTLGEILNRIPDNPAVTGRALGILATGVAHYKDSIHQTALAALCRDVLSSHRLPLEVRRREFLRIHKKLLCLLTEPRENRLTFFNRAAMLNHLYRFLVECEVNLGSFPLGPEKPVAFFPGTFDPFSVGHKRIVEEIRALGFEVYLAIDEFSWSKRTLPKLRRRKIAAMSVAGLWNVYLFPDEIPVNIAVPEDLAALQALFPGRELYLVAGSDVIRHASAYQLDAPGSAASYNHVIFRREEAEQPGDVPLERIIRGKLKLLTLPSYYETVSSTRIREYVDKNLDISMLVDPVAQSYIYEYGLYLRSPQFKQVLEPQELYYRRYGADELPEFLKDAARGRNPMAVSLHNRRDDRLLGWACGHTAAPYELYEVVEDLEAASFVRRHTSGRILVLDQVHCLDGENPEVCRRLVNELLARSLTGDHTYGLCRLTQRRPALLEALEQLGFAPIPQQQGLYYVDMRDPMIFIQDVYLSLKLPHRDDPEVQAVVEARRPAMRRALAELFPGGLVLTFDAETLNQALLTKVQAHNPVQDVPKGGRRLGACMCVPYGKILSDAIVPNTVTKTLHVEKVYTQDISSFTVEQYPGYSSLVNQIRTIKSFRRPVLLVDDLLHKGYRIDNLDPLFKAEGVDIRCILVGIMSGRGNDLMQLQGRAVDCEYFIPNLHYWFTESGLYPFLGGDSVEGGGMEQMLPSINMILPYYYPKYIYDAPPAGIRRLSRTALESACAILETLERQHQRTFNTALTLRRLGEAVHSPRLPDKGREMRYDLSIPASAYVREDLTLLLRTETE